MVTRSKQFQGREQEMWANNTKCKTSVRKSCQHENHVHETQCQREEQQPHKHRNRPTTNTQSVTLTEAAAWQWVFLFVKRTETAKMKPTGAHARHWRVCRSHEHDRGKSACVHLHRPASQSRTYTPIFLKKKISHTLNIGLCIFAKKRGVKSD